MGKILWQQMRRGEIEQAAKDNGVVIVAIGSTEQHGPHLPVDTDMSIVWEVATRAAAKVQEFPVLVAPPVWSGYSPHHMVFPGTITLSLETFVNLLVEVASSIAQHGFKKILLLNGHGGNHHAVATAAMKLNEKGVMVAAATYWYLAVDEINQIRDSEPGGMGHACELETSVQMRLHPELVDETAIEAHPKVAISSFFARDLTETGSVYYSPVATFARPGFTGVSGDPTKATPEKGEKILEAVATKLAAFLREYRAI
ncbi:MAG: creatininase family protein [Actinobacteria bacterium]|nr:creatininase family protein [Actinomycetota bacterium]